MNKQDISRLTTILLADGRSLENRDIFAYFFSLVNEERKGTIEKMRFDEEKVLSLAGGVLLDALLRLWGIDAPVAHDEGGRPRVPGFPSVFLSLSHAYPYAAAVISHHPCGIDIEDQSRDLSGIVRRYYLPQEQAYAAGDPARATDIWCRKECVIKYDHPRDIRRIDTFAIGEDYRYLHIPVSGFSCQALIPKGEYRFLWADFQKEEWIRSIFSGTNTKNP